MPLDSQPTGSRVTVTLRQLAGELAGGHNLANKAAEALADELMALMTRHLSHGHGIRLTGLGTLHVLAPPPLRGLNLQTGEIIEVRRKGKIAFRPAKASIDLV